MRRSHAALYLTIASCGGDIGTPDVCRVQLSTDLGSYTVPFTARVTANVSLVGSGAGSYSWSVSGPEGAITDFVESSPVASRIDFGGSLAGAYSVTVQLSYDDGSCSDSINLIAAEPGATARTYRLRFTPFRPEDPPPQEAPGTITVLSGIGDYPIGEQMLGAGLPRSGHVLDAADGPLSAHLRFDPLGGIEPIDVLVGSDGAWARALDDDGVYDAVIAPYGTLPAMRVESATAITLGDFTVTAGDRVTGHVRDGGGSPVAGARVSIRAGEVPASIATTDGAGAFEAWIHAAYGPATIRVSPPAGSGLADVELSDTAVSSTVEVSLPATTPQGFTANVEGSGGAPLPGAAVTFRSTSLPNATVTVDGVAHPAAAIGRAVAVADGGGSLSLSLPRASYQVFVEPPGSAVAEVASVTTFTLSSSAAQTFASSAGRAVTITVLGDGGQPVGNARVTLVSQGDGGLAAGGAIVTTTNASGVAFAQAPAFVHDVTIDPPVDQQMRLARARLTLGAADASLAATLPTAVILQGEVVYPSGAPGVSGIRVEAICLDCEGGPRVTGETLTGPGGGFFVPVPDPGP